MKRVAVVLLVSIVGLACGVVSSRGAGASGSHPHGPPVRITPMPHAPCRSDPPWIVNTTTTSPNFTDVAGDPVLYDVQCVQLVVIPGLGPFFRVESTDIPEYSTAVDSDLIADLDGRAADDFRPPSSTYSLMTPTIEFGDDINFEGCPRCVDPPPVGSMLPPVRHEGYGYWPPGPACPTKQSRQFLLPASPRKEVGDLCQANTGSIGRWVNGVSMFNYWDGRSYDDENVWHRLAYYFEKYDLDICQGHAAGSIDSAEYHHHSYPTCLGDRLDDHGDHVSPILGYAADGYPVLGPWVTAGVLATTCWKPRAYTPLSPTGCGMGTFLERSCLMVDPTNPSLGTMPASSAGPRVGSIQTPDDFATWRTISADSGVFVEDYYWDTTCHDPHSIAQLDVHNGHSTHTVEAREYSEFYGGKLSGYHYHTVRVETDPPTTDADGHDALVDVFPFIVGPTFFGHVPTSAAYAVTGTTSVRCCDPYVDHPMGP